MPLLGLCAYVILPSDSSNEQVLFGITNLLFHPIFADVILAAMLLAIISTSDSQLLVAASSLSHDLSRNDNSKGNLWWPRCTVAIMCSVAQLLLLLLYMRLMLFFRVYHSLGQDLVMLLDQY